MKVKNGKFQLRYSGRANKTTAVSLFNQTKTKINNVQTVGISKIVLQGGVVTSLLKETCSAHGLLLDFYLNENTSQPSNRSSQN